ncbi:MAG: hypothetical protein JWM35_483, partial [Verrucomicrobia bacterium]|nr:hypothetical protein [Verrucomicrobiota bacterium]
MHACESAQLVRKIPRCSRARRLGFDYDRGLLLSVGAEADERAALHVRMLTKNLFHGFGVKRASGGNHAFRFASDEPKPANVIDESAVAHAVPDFEIR